MKKFKVCMAGFGAVGSRFCQLLIEKEKLLAESYGVEIVFTGVSTPSRGTVVQTGGISPRTLLETEKAGRDFSVLEGYGAFDPIRMLEVCGAECFIEVSTLSIADGEPATSYIKKAFEKGMHVITANKGPEAWHFNELVTAAQAAGREYLYETIVMDGTPVFNLFTETLRGNELLGVRGILNGTSNFVLDRLENGDTYDQAIKKAQDIQLAEADPSLDVDGWDGAAKICAMADILMDAGLTPKDVERISVRDVTVEDIRAAKAQGKKIKYICKAEKTDRGVKLSVKPEQIADSDPLYRVDGTSAAVTLYTDLAGEMTVVQTDPGILQTAYGVFSDLLTLFARIGI